MHFGHFGSSATFQTGNRVSDVRCSNNDRRESKRVSCGGVSGWGYPATMGKSVSVIVRLHYKDGQTEDISLLNGEHFSDYIREVDVPGSKLAFKLRGQQIRYLAVHPKRTETIEQVEFVKGPDATAPVIMAVTIEAPDAK